VTPGFVDAHTHLDAQLMWDPLGTPACWHGTTTVVVGNCGVSFAPVRPEDRELLARTLESVEDVPARSIMASLTWRWESYGGYLEALGARPLGVNVGGLDGSSSPVRASAWKALYDRSPGERLAALEDETVRRALLDVPRHTDERIGTTLSLFGPDSCDYQRDPERRLDRVAARRGERPVETVVAPLRETHGRQLFASAGSNQVPAHVEEVLDYRDTLIGLGDAGAHVTGICDSSLTTHTLTYWCRERGKLGLEEAVRRLTSDPADAFGIPERGRLAPGMRADVNVIDFDALAVEVPEFVRDFPAGAGRWTQRARGYDYTLVNGRVAIEQGNHTGRLAGQLVRGA
jgi:N-acyl-D-aspartate/D-glutamate deacylase